MRAMVFANRAMQSRSALQREADNWLAEAGTVPPGAALCVAVFVLCVVLTLGAAHPDLLGSICFLWSVSRASMHVARSLPWHPLSSHLRRGGGGLTPVESHIPPTCTFRHSRLSLHLLVPHSPEQSEAQHLKSSLGPPHATFHAASSLLASILATSTGNGAEQELWDGARAGAGPSMDVSLMTGDELAEYEDRKLKMRKVG